MKMFVQKYFFNVYKNCCNTFIINIHYYFVSVMKGCEELKIDISMVERAKKGDDEAFAGLYELIYKDMYKYAFYLLGNALDAEDVVSDTVYEMYIGINKLRKTDSFKNWAFKILANRCKKKRGQYINKNISLDDENNVNILQNVSCEKQSKDIDLTTDLEKAFEILDYVEKQVVALSVFGGYKSKEISSILKIKPTTVRSKLSRALGKMKTRLETH